MRIKLASIIALTLLVGFNFCSMIDKSTVTIKTDYPGEVWGTLIGETDRGMQIIFDLPVYNYKTIKLEKGTYVLKVQHYLLTGTELSGYAKIMRSQIVKNSKGLFKEVLLIRYKLDMSTTRVDVRKREETVEVAVPRELIEISREVLEYSKISTK